MIPPLSSALSHFRLLSFVESSSINAYCSFSIVCVSAYRSAPFFVINTTLLVFAYLAPHSFTLFASLISPHINSLSLSDVRSLVALLWHSFCYFACRLPLTFILNFVIFLRFLLSFHILLSIFVFFE